MNHSMDLYRADRYSNLYLARMSAGPFLYQPSEDIRPMGVDFKLQGLLLSK